MRTLQVTVSTTYNAAERTLAVHAKQHTPATPDQDNKLPVLIPLAVGLLGPDGHDLPLRLQVGSMARMSNMLPMHACIQLAMMMMMLASWSDTFLILHCTSLS